MQVLLLAPPLIHHLICPQNSSIISVHIHVFSVNQLLQLSSVPTLCYCCKFCGVYFCAILSLVDTIVFLLNSSTLVIINFKLKEETIKQFCSIILFFRRIDNSIFQSWTVFCFDTIIFYFAFFL